MQIAVVNQKTKSIRSRSFGGDRAAARGSSSATSVAAAAEQDAQPQQLENRTPTHGDPRLVNSDQRRGPYRSARFRPLRPPKREREGSRPPSRIHVGGRTYAALTSDAGGLSTV